MKNHRQYHHRQSRQGRECHWGIGRSKADCQSRWQGDRRLDTRQGVFDQGGGSIHIALHAGWDGWKNQLPICWLGRNGRLSGCDGYHQRISFSSRRSRDAKWDVLCCVGANKLYRHLQRRRRRRSLCRSSIYCCARRCHTQVQRDPAARGLSFHGMATHSQRNGNREYHIYCCVGGNKAHTDTHDLRRSYVDPYRLSRSHVEPHRCPRSSQNGGWKRAGDLDWPAAAWRRRHGGSCAAYEKEKKLRHKNTGPVP